MNLFAEIVHSVCSLKSYVQFREGKGSRAVLYGIFLNLLYAAAAVALPVAVALGTAGGLENWVKNAVPDFVLEDGRLWVEEPVEYADLYTYLQVDTSRPVTQEITKSDLLAFEQAAVIDAEHILVKAEGQLLTASFAELGIPYLDRDTLLSEALPWLGGLGALLLLAGVWIQGFTYFAGAFLTAMIGAGLASRMKYRISFGDLCKLAVHARTAPLLLELLYGRLPVYIPFFGLLMLLVSAGYMQGALKILQRAEA